MTPPRTLLLLAAGCALAGGACRCGPKAAPRAVLRRALAVEPAALPALDPSDGYARFVSSFVYQGLTAVPDVETGRWEPRLAEEITATADARQLAVKLRPGIRFHDGGTLTADDVVATFRFVLDPARPAGRLRAELGGLESVYPAGPDRVVLVWPRPWFRAEASLSLVPILPARSIAAGPASWAMTPPPGTGPFCVARWRRGERIELARFEQGPAPRPGLEGISFRIVPDPSTQLQAFRAGELDVLNVAPGAFLRARAELERDPRWRAFTYPSTRVDVLFLNNRNGPCGASWLRQEIARAVNRQAMSQAFSGGLDIPIRGPVLPGPGGLTGLEPPPAVDATGPVRHLGMDHDLTLRVAAGGPERGQVAEAIRDQLARIGLPVRIEASDFGRLLADVHAGNFDMVLLQVQVGADEDPWDSWHSRGSANYAGYSSPSVDELLDRARGLRDGAQREALFEQAALMIAADHAAVFLWRVGVVTLASKRLQGVEPPHLGPEDIVKWRLLPAEGGR